MSMNVTRILKFTFQYGEIKSRSQISVQQKARRFTFQYGEIKSEGPEKIRSIQQYLHSSMERLKGAF